MEPLIPRQINFLKLMLKEDEHKPLNYFAKSLNVSSKTLQNDLKIINKYIVEFNLSISKKRGIGICLDSKAKENIEFINSLNINIKSNKSADISVEKRRIEILRDLLLKSDMKTSINKLSEKYFVSKTSIVNDLKYIEDEYLSKNNIRLNRTLNGTYISGSEVDIRKCIANLIECISNEENYNIDERTRIEKSTFDDLANVFGIESIRFIEARVKELEVDLNCEICEPYYINLITHILICIRRIKEGNKIKVHDDVESNIIKEDFRYIAVIKLIKKIEKEYSILLDNQEVSYIYKYIVSSRIENDIDFEDINEELYESIASEMIDFMSELLNINLKMDNILKQGLIMHIKPMMNRLIYDIQIKNPLYDDILNHFNDIFILTKIVVFVISEKYKMSNISDDEISYLTTYFQAAIERNNDIKKVLIVCHSGYGTSQFLASKLKQTIPNINIVDIISSRKLNKETVKNVDFIISTVETDFKGKEHIIVSALLTESDINNIKKMVDKNYDNKNRNVKENILQEFSKYEVLKKEVLHDYNIPKFEFKDGLNIYINKNNNNKNKVFIGKQNKKIEIFIDSNNDSYIKNTIIKTYSLYKDKNIDSLFME
ncbi:BglG family transcription antiterminator [Peptacetobacter hiranonis]|nr:transcription antiterminator [Peptacetobacter hiranonis]QEK19817.1 Transcriptional regulator ManR [Peptacetobacter hiranonis]